MVNVTAALLTQDAAIDGIANSPALSIPPSIQHMIAQQFEHLPPEEQHLLEVASAAGIEFAAAMVAPSLTTDVATVEDRCAGLARREQFLRATGMTHWPEGTTSARYSFRHALYQEVIYDRVTPSRRLQVHQQIGERLEQGYGPQAETIAAELALHFERAHDYLRAVNYYEQAGYRASQRVAHVETVSHLTKGLDLLKALPDTPERSQQELRLQLALGVSLVLSKGFGAQELEAPYTRARELCQQEGEPSQLFSALYGLRRFYFARGQIQTAHELGEHMIALSRTFHDTGPLARAHLLHGDLLLYRGEFIQARAHIEQGVALYDLVEHRSHALLYGSDTGPVGLAQASSILWMLGYPDTALQRSNEALTLAQRVGHPFTLAFVLAYTAFLHGPYGYLQRSHELNETLLEVVGKHDFLFYLTLGNSRKGFRLAVGGQKEEGFALMYKSLAVWQDRGEKLEVPSLLVGLAEAHWRVGQPEEGLVAVTDALKVMAETGERYHEALLYNLKGWLTLQHKSGVRNPQSHFTPPIAPEEAEGYFHHARTIVRQQQAKMYELFATTGLVWLALWRTPDEKRAAHQMLSEVYNWFTEGFDTEPLKNAKAVLEALA